MSLCTISEPMKNKQLIFISILFLLTNACNTQTTEKSDNNLKTSVLLTTRDKTIGIGRLQVSLNHDIPLYDSETDLLVDTISFSSIKSGKDKGRLVCTANFLLDPIEYYVGESDRERKSNNRFVIPPIAASLAFKVLRCTENGFEVVVNEKSFETAIIKSNSSFKMFTRLEDLQKNIKPDEGWCLYETWDNYLSRVWRVTATHGQKIYDSIEGKEVEPNSFSSSGTVIEVKGNWVKLNISEYPDTVKKIAWMQWTDGKELLVRADEFLYE